MHACQNKYDMQFSQDSFSNFVIDMKTFQFKLSMKLPYHVDHTSFLSIICLSHLEFSLQSLLQSFLTPHTNVRLNTQKVVFL